MTTTNLRDTYGTIDMEKQLHISDIVQEYISGDWGEDSNPDNSLVKVACVRGADINDVNGSSFKDIPVRYITSSSLSKKGLKEGNIVIEKSGGAPTQSTGRVAYISKECIMEHPLIVCSNFCAAFSVKPEWDAQYIFYYLQYFYNTGVFFNFEGKTSGLHNLDIEHAFASIPIKRIDIDDQRHIASVLSNLDRKIALNRQINTNLEALARQLYDYWFVQFDFPDANGKPYKSSGGKMTYNEKLKRHIPDGWEDGRLADIANITMGQSPDGRSYNKEGKGIIFYQGCTDFGERFPDVRQYTTEPSRYAKKGDILMSVRAPVGALNIANNDCCIGRGLAAINSKLGSMTHLYYVMLSFKEMFDRMSDVGTTFGSITKDELYGLPVVKPDGNIIKKYEKKCKPICEQQMILGAEISSLTRQRDELLPLLMNGQVTV